MLFLLLLFIDLGHFQGDDLYILDLYITCFLTV